MGKLASSIARDIASPAVKMGNRSLFPGVAVPLAFFCTLFFRHRKKSVSALQDCKSCFRAAVGASVSIGRRPAPAGAPKGLPRSKQSARAALPCAPIAICLHPSGSFPKRNELPSKRPALPSHEGGSSPFSHQNRAALLFGKRPMFIFVCQSFSASRSTFASAAATHSSTAALYASSCLVLSRDS